MTALVCALVPLAILIGVAVWIVLIPPKER